MGNIGFHRYLGGYHRFALRDRKKKITSDMYYWLKQPYGYGVYIVCDHSNDVYHVCNGMPSLIKPQKHPFLKFNPYLELVNITDEFLDDAGEN